MVVNTNYNLISGILVKYLLFQPLTGEEEVFFDTWKAESEENKLLAERFADPQWVANHRRELNQTPKDSIGDRVRRSIH